MLARRSAVPLALVLLAAGCADDDSTTAPQATSGAVIVSTTTTVETPRPTGSSDTPGTPGTTPATAPTTTTGPTVARPPVIPDPNVTPSVATGVVGEFDQPVDLAVRPNDPALYVVEQPGRVVRSDGEGTVVVLDVTDLTDSEGERGLLGLAFHPSEPLAYVNYTTADTGDTVIAEYPVAGDGSFDAASARTVLGIDQPYPNHNGGGLTFGPDGYLYIGTGDGGSGGDPERRANDPFDLLGKLLRIDPVAGDPYAVPADNPYADGSAGAPEVWSIGLRNPWRFAFDVPTGDLWIADVGQNEFEEVNRVGPADGRIAGYAADFGWSAFEGTERFNRDVPEPATHAMPVVTYTHAEGCSVSGGFVYRGPAVPDLQGWYLYSDYCSGTLWGLDVTNARNIVLASDLGEVTAVRPGPGGEAYALVHSGELLRIAPAGG